MGKLLGIMRKAGWNLGDQILSAASNVALSIIVANSVDKYVFGAFAIAFVVFGVGIALARSIVGQPLQIRYAAAPPHEQHAAIGRAHGLAVVLGLALGAVCALASIPMSGALAQALLADSRGDAADLPPGEPLPRLADAILITDGLSPAGALAQRIATMASSGDRIASIFSCADSSDCDSASPPQVFSSRIAAISASDSLVVSISGGRS